MKKLLTLILLSLALILCWFLFIKPCDTWNIAIGKEQADGSVDIQYIRICKDDYKTLEYLLTPVKK